MSGSSTHIDAFVGERLSTPPASAIALEYQHFIFRTWLVLTDVLALVIAFSVAYWLRFDIQLTVSPEVVPQPAYYPSLSAILILVVVLVFAGSGLYNPGRLLGGVWEYSNIFNACSAATLMVVVATFVMPQFVVSRGWVVSGWLLSFLVVSANRFLCRRLAYALRRHGYLLTRAVIVGTNEEALALADELRRWQESGLNVIGLISNDTDDSTCRDFGLPLLGSVADIRKVIEDHDVEDLVIAITAVPRERLLTLCEEVNSAARVQLRLSSGLYELLATGVSVIRCGAVPLVSLSKFRLKPEELYIKAAVEYSLALVGVVFLAPLLLAIALSIRLDTRGPIIHRRKVLGISGKGFDALKFRTMYVNGDEILLQNPELKEKLDQSHKLKNDPRVTRVGKFLRKYSLDELPQLLNVLRGQMGLVGPRMITPKEAANYGRNKLNLLTVKPGITGLWQVSGRSDLSYEERVRLDMYYIRNYSIWLDLQILFVQTLPAVIKSRGAY